MGFNPLLFTMMMGMGGMGGMMKSNIKRSNINIEGGGKPRNKKYVAG